MSQLPINFDNIAYQNRVIIANGDVNEELEKHVITAIMDYNRKDENIEVREPITFMINSSGGLVSSAISICNTIFKSKTPVMTVNTGLSASAATLILVSGQKRFAYEHSFVMLHSMEAGSWGVVDNITSRAEYLKRLEDELTDIYRKRTKLPKQIYKDIMERHLEVYLSAKEALKYGLIDEII